MSRTENFKLRIGVFTLFVIGMSQADIARLYGVSRQRVGQMLHGYNNIKGISKDAKRI